MNPTHFLQKYGPWAVVTGASDGIGRAIATVLADRGLNLVLVARRRGALETLAAELASKSGVEVRVHDADLSSVEATAQLVHATESLDVGLFVGCAGFGGSGPLLDADLAHELNMVDLNCRSLVHASVLFGRRLAKRRRGGLVLMSSLVAFQGVPRAANYAATKAYVQTLAEGLQIELAPLGVDVLASAPGPVLTGFGQRADMRMTSGLTPDVVAAATIDALGTWQTVRPGWLSKALELALMFLPRFGRVRAMGLVMNGMTKHQLPGA